MCSPARVAVSSELRLSFVTIVSTCPVPRDVPDRCKTINHANTALSIRHSASIRSQRLLRRSRSMMVGVTVSTVPVLSGEFRVPGYLRRVGEHAQASAAPCLDHVALKLMITTHRVINSHVYMKWHRAPHHGTCGHVTAMATYTLSIISLF